MQLSRFNDLRAPHLACRGRKFLAALLVCLGLTVSAPSQTFTNLITFNGTDGEFPSASLIQGIDGNFYGTTSKGGAYNGGSVFKITPAGKLTTLYSFCPDPIANCPDGSNPDGLVLATNGMFYGTTQYGGPNGSGSIFQMTEAGKLKTLYSFCSQANCTDGEEPAGPLVQGTSGKFYGVTPLSGSTGESTSVIFEITTSGAFTVLSTAPTDTFLNGPLTQATDGNFYTTGGNFSDYEDGAIFKIKPTGSLSAIFAFDDTDGNGPLGALLQGPNGDLYGTTSSAPGTVYYGTVFQLTLSGTENTVYGFAGGADGGHPTTGVILGTDGNFYGTSQAGTGKFCSAVCGIIFQLTQGGTLTPLYDFCSKPNCTDGLDPNGLLQGTDGNFYGTTFGGPGVDGTVFKLSVGLGPFVKTLPTSGVVGEQVGILGNNLKGTTAVSFNGTAATFKVYSNTLILTTVPAGATTGTVEVATPSGTLAGNVAFLVK
jgi:uncharacterized repeat protein (TIGR03803 family)